MRILMAGLIGGIVMFIWGSVVHTLLPIGEMGLHVPTDQPAALSALAQTAKAGEGIYMYPSMAPEQMGDKAAMAAFVEANKDSPFAFVVYQPGGNPIFGSMAPNLVKQLVSDILAALVAAWILAMLVTGFQKRVVVASALGLFAWLTISVPYWNWYMFPVSFTLGALIEQVVGWGLAGAAIAWWLGRRQRL
jgi:hypothetical protein